MWKAAETYVSVAGEGNSAWIIISRISLYHVSSQRRSSLYTCPRCPLLPNFPFFNPFQLLLCTHSRLSHIFQDPPLGNSRVQIHPFFTPLDHLPPILPLNLQHQRHISRSHKCHARPL